MILLFSGGYDSTLLAIRYLEDIDILLHISYDHPSREQEQTASLRIFTLLKQKKPTLRFKKISLPIVAKELSIGSGKSGSRYVSNRNAIFLSVASNYGYSVGCTKIMYGASMLDIENYPDCRPDFIEKISDILNVTILAPLLTESFCIQSKILDRCWSCYEPIDGQQCGKCDSCLQSRR